MNLFLKRLLLFLSPFVLLLFSLEIAIRKIPNTFQLKDNYLQKNSAEIETLILGSSHMFYGVNPLYLDSKAFNYSNVSQSPDMDLAILKTYEDSLQNLKNVIIRLSYDTLFEQLKDSPEDWRLKNYKLYTDVNFEYKLKHNSEVISTGTRQALKTIKDYYFKDIPVLNCDDFGWANDLNRKQKPNLDDVGVRIAKKHTAKKWDLLKANIENFDKILNWCNKRGVKAFVITPPSYKSYSDNLEEKQLAKMLEIGRYLDSKHKSCTFINLLESEDFKSEDFFDPDHLNVVGSKKFSLIINDLIEN